MKSALSAGDDMSEEQAARIKRIVVNGDPQLVSDMLYTLIDNADRDFSFEQLSEIIDLEIQWLKK
jgi:hypothetical protein